MFSYQINLCSSVKVLFFHLVTQLTQLSTRCFFKNTHKSQKYVRQSNSLNSNVTLYFLKVELHLN